MVTNKQLVLIQTNIQLVQKTKINQTTVFNYLVTSPWRSTTKPQKSPKMRKKHCLS